MGVKTRIRSTGKGPVSRDTLNRYQVVPVSFDELKWEEARVAEKRRLKRKKEAA